MQLNSISEIQYIAGNNRTKSLSAKAVCPSIMRAVSSMVGTKERYICTKRNDYFGERRCQEQPIPGALIEDVTWDYILGLIQNQEEFEEKLRQAQAKEAATMQPKQEELEHLIALLREIEIEADEIARASIKAKGIIASKLELQGEEVNNRYEAFSNEKVNWKTHWPLNLPMRSLTIC